MATVHYFLLLIFVWSLFFIQLGTGTQEQRSDAVEEDWGDGLKVLSIYKPDSCEHRTKENDVIHYHYVGRLASDGSVFGKSFDYNTPYIVALGQRRIIAGMDRGLMGMCLWERRRVSFPPHLGYGERGVGSTIPPNSSLVFYVRLIKIERNGHVLGEDGDIVDLWNSGLVSYSNQRWQQAVDMIEEAVHLYDRYRDQTLACIRQCYQESNLEGLSSSKKKLLENDSFRAQFLLYGIKGECISECKRTNLPPKLRSPDPVVMKKFSKRIPYSYLHYAYYQMEEFDIATRSCFTFLHYNPTDSLALSSVSFYRNKLNLTADEYIYRNETIVSHQESYLKGKQVYHQDKWLEAADLFESSLAVFQTDLSDCYLLCDDLIQVNLTEPNINTMKKSLLDEYGFQPDTMEYYELLRSSIREVLQCRNECFDQQNVIEGSVVEDYLISHFNYLQFSYYKLGNIHKASEAAGTYLAMDPSSDSMISNVQFYTSTYQLSSESFVPRREFVDIHEKHEMNKRLLYLSEHGEMRKREGKKGDSGQQHPPHQEL